MSGLGFRVSGLGFRVFGFRGVSGCRDLPRLVLLASERSAGKTLKTPYGEKQAPLIFVALGGLV